MHDEPGRYSDWQQIDYRPAISQILPRALLKYVAPGETVLEIGCHSGATAVFLAKCGMQVHGLDLNTCAIEASIRLARQEGLDTCVSFQTCDFLKYQGQDEYDAVVLIRVLTCVPDEDSWRQMLARAYASVRSGGHIYINDFLRDDSNQSYKPRYDAGARKGWRQGNFEVNDSNDELLFIAHHHSRKEVEEMTACYETLEFREYQSLSMNGNRCRMFEFIGTKP